MLERRPDLKHFLHDRIAPLHVESPLLNLQQNVPEVRYELPVDQLADLPPLKNSESEIQRTQTKFDRASVLESMPVDSESFKTWFKSFEQSFTSAIEECEAEPNRVLREWQKIQATRAHTDVLVNALHNEFRPLPSLVLMQELFLAVLPSPVYIQLRASERVEAAMIGLIRRAIGLGINLIDVQYPGFQAPNADSDNDEQRLG